MIVCKVVLFLDCNVKGYTGVMLTSDNASGAFKKSAPKPAPPPTNSMFEVPHICAVVTQHRCRVVSSQGWLFDAYLANRPTPRYASKVAPSFW